jgi:uncharacterized protein (DUF305 family)
VVAQRRMAGPVRMALGLLVALAALALFWSPATAQPPVPDFVPDRRQAQLEQDFLMGMIPHHRGAIMMSRMALEKATKPELKELAQKVISAQEMEIQLMSNYLRDWYGMQPPAGDMMSPEMMREMDMPMMHGTMPSMEAMMRQMEGLRTKTGADFDIAYMSALAEHHAMASMMAASVLVGGYHGDLYKLAARIVKDQGEEIVQLQAWLEQWYGIDRPLRSQ